MCREDRSAKECQTNESHSGIRSALALATLFIAISLPAFADVVVNFPDPGLEAVIRDAIEKPTGDILDTDLIGLTWLAPGRRNISDLEGMQYCTDLRELYLLINEIVDISPLSGLTNLRKLNLQDNQIVDISPLTGLTNLWMLFLHNNEIGDVSVLSSLTNLTSLFLSNNPIGDVSVLSSLTNLTSLGLSDNNIANISVLSNLTNLTRLGLSDNNIANISVLSNLTNLTRLGLGDNQIANISILSGLTNLEELTLYGNEIVDISALSGLTNLTRLFLWGNEIVDINALSGLINLTDLRLEDNEIVDISVLSGLTKLTTLTLQRNQIVDNSPVSRLTNLELLYLHENQIIDISVLSGLTKLITLGLHENQIADVTALSGLTNLTTLYLNSNYITDMQPLLDNLGIGSGDHVDVCRNYLDLTGGSEDMQAITTLQARGVDLYYMPQREGPFLAYEGYGVDDSLFDYDNEVDPGETIALSVELRNDGLGEAHAVTATLSTLDPDIDILKDSVEVAANVLPGETCTAAGFLFDVDSSFNGKPIEFILNVTSNEGGWDHTFVVVPEWRRDLTRGDVVFYRELSLFPMYSHVGIYLGEGWVIDSHGRAVPKGVQVRPIAFYDDRKAGAAYRVSCASPQQIEQALHFAVAQIGLPYHWIMINKDSEGYQPELPGCCPYCLSSHCFYCSELVWAAFLHATPSIDLAPSLLPLPVAPDELITASSCMQLIDTYDKALTSNAGVYVTANCPVDLILVDPAGNAVARDSLEIEGALYIDADLNGDGHRITAISIPPELVRHGVYTVEVVAKDTASSTDTYDLDVFQQLGQTTLAVDVPISEIPSEPYDVWVEGGSSSAVFRVAPSGNVYADQTFHSLVFETGAADIAEWVHITTLAEPGDVVEFDPIAPGQYCIAQDACSSLVAGVISTTPGVTLGGSLVASEKALLALIGIVPVKVTNEGGPIQPGDLLVTSSTPGHAMRWAGPDPCLCSMVGKALEPMTEEFGVILVLLTAH